MISASQDIAVDGLVLSILKEEHVGLGSTCQSAGQITGTIIASSMFIQLNSEKFCRNFIKDEKGFFLLSINQFLTIMAIYILVVNIYLHLFVDENKEQLT